MRLARDARPGFPAGMAAVVSRAQWAGGDDRRATSTSTGPDRGWWSRRRSWPSARIRGASTSDTVVGYGGSGRRPAPDSATITSVHVISVKLPTELHAVLSREARRRDVSQSFLVRELIANALSDGGGAPPPSCADLRR